MAVQNVFTLAKMVAVLIVISGGAWKLFQGKIKTLIFNLFMTSFCNRALNNSSGNVQHLSNAFDKPVPSMGVIATAFYTGLWSYDGWNNLNYVTEEIKNPSK